MNTKSKEEMQEVIARRRRRQNLREQAEREFNEIFWPQVRVKVSKGSALNAYVQMRLKGDVELSAQELVDCYNTYADQVQVRKYTKHPVTWIAGECWDDQFMAPPLTIEERIQRLVESEKVTTGRDGAFYFYGTNSSDQWGLFIGNPNCMVLLGEVSPQFTFTGTSIEECLQKAEAELL